MRKKIIGGMLAVIMALNMMACTPGQNTVVTQEPTATETAEVAEGEEAAESTEDAYDFRIGTVPVRRGESL